MAVWADKPLPEMVERLLFSTDVLRSYTAEWRVSRREARLQLEYSCRMSNARFAALEELVRANLTSDWTVPFWHERTRNVDISVGETSLTVDTDADYRPGGSVIIWKGCEEYEVATIDTVGSGLVTLTAPVSASYEAAAVMPAYEAYIMEPVATGRANRGLMDISVKFELRETVDVGATVWSTYLGYEVLNCASGYISRLQGVIRPTVEYIDSTLGTVVIENMRTVEDSMFSVELINHAWDAKQFLCQVRGRDYPFWVKAWGGQLEVESALSASNQITVNSSLSAAGLVDRHIVVDGIYRQITAAVDVTGDMQTLTLDSALGADVAAGAPTALIRLVRADSDEVEFKYTHGFKSGLTFPVIEVQAA